MHLIHDLYGQTRIAFKLAKKYLLLGWYILLYRDIVNGLGTIYGSVIPKAPHTKW
jgi:hypothetical protein